MSAQPNTTLRQALVQHFNFDDLKVLCFDLGIDSEIVPYAERGKEIYTFWIGKIVRQRNRLPELLAACAKARPLASVYWAHLIVEDTLPADLEKLFPSDQIILDLIKGIYDLPVRYDGNVRNFLSYYIGTDQQPAPFGGRAADLARLDDWLSDAAAPRYAFLAAPAGRGKSALLAHWVLRLQRRDDVHVVFFPISIRYGTNRDNVAFAALAARMAHVHGERVGRANDAQEYRSVFNDFAARPPADGKPVLIVLDALDEAAGWEAGAALFPNPPPPHLRVLVSARTRAGDADGAKWLTQLGWEGGRARLLTLGALDVDGVRDALQQMGNPLDALAPRYDIVNKLHELSEGDPLMVRLYVETLLPQGSRDATFSSDDLLSLKPGIKPFFDRWFDEQKKLWKGESAQETTSRDRAVNGLLNACALAKGPLSNADVLALCAQAPSPEIAGTLDLEWAAEQVNRFVIGDGSEKQGYVFSHPRLGYYFAERLTAKEREGWRERCLRYGRETLNQLNNGALKPKDASSYAVHFYGAHLSEAKSEPQAFYDLMNEGWLRAWEWIDGSASGFLEDCSRAWLVARQEGVSALGQMVKAALCRTSVASVSANVSSELLAACVKSGVLSLSVAKVIARLNPNLAECATALMQLSDAAETPIELLEEALTAVSKIDEEWSRANALHALSSFKLFEHTQLLTEALSIASKIGDEDHRASALRDVIRRSSFEQVQLLATALYSAREITDPWCRVVVLSAVAERLQSEQRSIVLAEALTVARAIKEAYPRAKALSVVAELLPLEQQLTIFSESLAAADVIGIEGSPEDAVKHIASRLPHDQSHLLIEALAVVRAIQDERSRARALIAVAQQIPSDQTQLLSSALETAGEIVLYEEFRAKTFSAVAGRLQNHQQLEVITDALAIAQEIRDERERAEVLCAVAEHLQPEQLHLLVRALTSAHAIENEEYRAKALSAIVVRLPHDQPRLLTEALTTACAIEGEQHRASVLKAIITHLQQVPPELFANLMIAIRAIKNGLCRADVLSAVAERLSLGQRSVVLVEALASAYLVGDERSQASTLSALARYLPSNHFQLLTEALAIAQATRDELDRTSALEVVFISLLPGQTDLLIKALAIVGTIKGEQNRSRALCALIRRLPPSHPNLLAKAWTEINMIEHERWRTSALRTFAEQLTPDHPRLLAETRAAAREIGDSFVRANTLCAIAKRLPSDLQPNALLEALDAARAAGGGLLSAYALSVVAQDLPPEQKFTVQNEALNIAREIEGNSSRVSGLIAVAECLSNDQQNAILAEALTVVSAVKDDPGRFYALNSILEHAAPNHSQLFTALLSAARLIWDGSSRVTIMCAIAKRLQRDQQLAVLMEALTIARAIEHDLSRVYALVAVANSPLGDQRSDLFIEALGIARTIGNSEFRVNALCNLANYLPPDFDFVQDILSIVMNEKRSATLGVLEALANTLHALGGERAIRETAQAIIDTAKWWP